MKQRFEVLDIFRGLFSAMVVLFHMTTFTSAPVVNNIFINNCDLFVDFFFVLSGFVISFTYRQIHSRSELQTFLQKRFFRIYPLHVIMLFIFVITELVKHFFQGHVQVNHLNNPNNNWLSFLSSLLLLNSVKMPGVHDVSWNIPSWSISAEMISYTVFALLLLLMSKANRKANTNMYYNFVIMSAIAATALITGSGKLNYSFDYGFLRGLAGFFTGSLCNNIFHTVKEKFDKLSTAFFNWAELLMLSGIIYFVYAGEVFKQVGFVYEIIFFAAVLLFAVERGCVSLFLKRSAFLKNMGKYSYSVYMTHAFLLSIFNIIFIRIFHLPSLAYNWLFLPNYLFIYKVSQWTYNNIEMRFASKRKTAPAVRLAKKENYYLKDALSTAASQ